MPGEMESPGMFHLSYDALFALKGVYSMEKNIRMNNQQVAAWKRFGLLHVFEGKIRIIEDWLNLASVFIIMFLMFFATAEIIVLYAFSLNAYNSLLYSLSNHFKTSEGDMFSFYKFVSCL